MTLVLLVQQPEAGVLDSAFARIGLAPPGEMSLVNDVDIVVSH